MIKNYLNYLYNIFSGVLILSFENLQTHFRQNLADLGTSVTAAAASVNKLWISLRPRDNLVHPEAVQPVPDSTNMTQCADSPLSKIS